MEALILITKDKVTYLHCPYTYTGTRVNDTHMERYVLLIPPGIVIIHWVAESKHPFAIVRNPGFMDLMKTGHPMLQLPSPSTVALNVKQVFVIIWSQITAMLKVLSFLFMTLCHKH